MKLAIIGVYLLVACSAQNNRQVCLPPKCSTDSNCVDSIHLINAKCCGGVCVQSSTFPQNRLVGEPCAPPLGETCGGVCASGLYCSQATSTCNFRKPPGCNCTAASECASSSCVVSDFPTNYQVCRASNQPLGGFCLSSTDCSGGYYRCVNHTCAPIPLYQSCPYQGAPYCDPNAVCRYNISTFTYLCQPPCQIGEQQCCYNTAGCVGGVPTPSNQVTSFCQGFSQNYTCAALPVLGEGCTASPGCANSLNNTCANPCNGTTPGTACSTGILICMRTRSFALGQECVTSTMCPLNSTCTYISPGPANTCVGYHTIPLGNACPGTGTTNNLLCQAPADRCVYNGSSYLCDQSGQVPAYQECNPSNFPTDCQNGTLCQFNASAQYMCTPPPPPTPAPTSNPTVPKHVGDFCVTGDACPGGSANCQPQPHSYYQTTSCSQPYYNCTCIDNTIAVPTGGICILYGSTQNLSCAGDPTLCRSPSGGSCFSRYYGCQCIELHTIPDGQPCNTTDQCAGPTSVCPTANKTCTNVVGMPCDQYYDCVDTNRYDCSCGRRCYQYNAPTPKPPTRAPTAPTPPTPSRCDAQLTAWNAARQAANFVGTDYAGYVYSYNFQNFIAQLIALPDSARAAAVDYTCCTVCPGSVSTRFNAPNVNGYQVDCRTKNFTAVVQSSCDTGKGALAMAGCWNPLVIGAASVPRYGFGVLCAVVFAFLF